MRWESSDESDLRLYLLRAPREAVPKLRSHYGDQLRLGIRDHVRSLQIEIPSFPRQPTPPNCHTLRQYLNRRLLHIDRTGTPDHGGLFARAPNLVALF